MFTEGVAEIRQPSKYRIILYLCAEWEAEKGGRMGCLMKEKIQGLAERKIFILLFLIVWALCPSSGNLTYRYSPPPLPLLTGLFNEHLVTSKNPLISEVR